MKGGENVELFNQKIKFDRENRVVTLEFQKANEVVARFTYNEKENDYQIFGGLRSVYGFKNTPEHEEKYNQMLKANAFLCKSILEQNK